MSHRDPPYSFVILARPPVDDDDEPPILSTEDTERSTAYKAGQS
jgi:hypothetical protein